MTDQPKPDQQNEDGLRFYIDHGVIHDRVTSKHVFTDGELPFEDDLPRVLAFLNSLAPVGERLMPLSDINDLDDVCRELGIQDSHVTPAQVVKELNKEIERLRALSSARDDAEGAVRGRPAITNARPVSDFATGRVPEFAAPPKPAPDAMREALNQEEQTLLTQYYSGRLNGDHTIVVAFDRLRALAAPVPPADRANLSELTVASMERAAQICRDKYCEIIPGKRTWADLTKQEREIDIVCLAAAVRSLSPSCTGAPDSSLALARALVAAGEMESTGAAEPVAAWQPGQSIEDRAKKLLEVELDALCVAALPL